LEAGFKICDVLQKSLLKNKLDFKGNI